MAQISNRARLSYDSTVISSNITVGELLPSLTVSKTSVGTTYSRDDEVTYIVSLVNRSEKDFTGLRITDDLGAYTVGTSTVYPLAYVEGSVRFYTNGVLGASPDVSTEIPLVFSGVTVPAGGNVMIIYKTNITEFAPLDIGSEITNTVTVSAPCTVSTALPVSDSETVTAKEAPDLAITKHMEPTTVIENDSVTYTFIIDNFGNTAADASLGIVLTDTFTPPLSKVTVSLNGTPLSSPANFTYSESTGAFATVSGQITVPAATFTQDPATGIVTVVPGSSTLVVTGTI